jgi:thioredoxin reductase (NADPH)
MYDNIIIGGGPAGYSAALYSARAKLDTLVIEKMFSGGQMATTDVMENYPGFEEPIGGADLALRMEKQARKFGAVVLNDEVLEINIDSKIKVVKTKKNTYQCKVVILCMGAYPKELGIAKENSFIGSGVSYCAVCDGAFYKGKTVVVVGGGDTAAEDALYLARFCPKIYIVHSKEKMRATKLLQDELSNNRKIEFVWNSVVEEIIGEFGVEGIKIRNLITDETSILKTDGLFVAVGLTPNTALIKSKVLLNNESYIITDEKMQTNIPGVYAAGDIREKFLRQVITAASDGASASYAAEHYINESLLH